MESERVVKPVKKTVVLHPMMDRYIRKTWAILIDQGNDATYSTALNWMLLATVFEAEKEGGLSQETKEMLRAFIEDQDNIKRLNLQDHLVNVKEFWGLDR